jgi:hypothetical protein
MNKKVVFLVVILECILAVFIVSFFGKAIEDARAKNLCQEIYFVDANGEKIPDGENIEVVFEGSSISYKLYWEIIAPDATEKEVEFISNNDLVKLSLYGKEKNCILVTFVDKEASAEITILAKDGSGKKDVITLMPEMKDGGDIDFD